MTIKDYSHYNDTIFYHAFLQCKNIKSFFHISNNSYQIFQKQVSTNYFKGLRRKLEVINTFNIDRNFRIYEEIIFPIHIICHNSKPLSCYRNGCINGIKSYNTKNKNL